MSKQMRTELSKMVCNQIITSGSEFQTLMQAIKSLRSSEEIALGATKLLPIDKGDGNVYSIPNLIASDEQKDEANASGAYALETANGTFLVLEGALQLLMNRAEVSCPLYERLRQANNREGVCDLYNFGISYQSDTAAMRLGFISGMIQNAGSKQYQERPQDELFEDIELCLRASYPDMRLMYANYSHDFTRAVYSLEPGNGAMMAAYKKSLKAAGYDEATIKAYEPCVEVTTSDASKSSVIVRAVLKHCGNGTHRSDYITFGDNQSERHYGSKATASSLSNKLDKVFTNLKDNQARAIDLMNIKLNYPEAVMTAIMEEGPAAKKTLYATCTKACDDTLEMFQYHAEPGVTTAYDIYMWLCDMLNSAEMMKLKEETRLTADERIFRKLFSPYDEYDVDGPIRPRKLGKKAQKK